MCFKYTKFELGISANAVRVSIFVSDNSVVKILLLVNNGAILFSKNDTDAVKCTF